MLSSQALTSAALVGQTVLAQASSASYTSGRRSAARCRCPPAPPAVTLTISNAEGAVVNRCRVPASARPAELQLEWRHGNGRPAPSGTYNVAATAVVGGNSQTATTYLTGTVSSVSLGASGTGVELNTPQLGAVALSSVQQID